MDEKITMLSDKNWVPVTREELGWASEEEAPKEDPQPEGVWTDSEGNVIENIDVYSKPPVTMGEFSSKMFGAGVDQVQGLGMGFVGLAGDLAGVESVKKLGLEGFNDNMREAAMAREEVGMVDFTDIEGVGDAAKWAYGTLLEQAPQLIPTIALGGAGGLAGKQFAKGVVQSAVQKAIANGLTEKAAAVTVANAVASRGGMKYAAKRLMEGGLTREAAEGALGQVATARIAPIAGAAAGNLATGIGMETGSIYGDTEEAGLALKYGIPAGAIEGFTDTLIGSPFIRRAFGVNVAKNTADGAMLKEIGKGVAKGVALEGPAEELPQTYLEQMARAEDDPNFDINSEEARREQINAVAAGSFIGGAIGGAGGVVERLAPVTANALKGLVQKPLEDPEVPDAEGLPSGDIVYDKDSVTLDGGVVMRRWNIEKTGDTGWAVENAPQDALDKISAVKGGIVQDGKLFVFSNTQEGASLFDRAETAVARARGEIVDEDGDGIPDDQEKDDSDLTALDLSGNESVIQAAKQKETKKAVVEAGIPADAVDELIKDLRDSGVDDENIVETAKATAATLPAPEPSATNAGQIMGTAQSAFEIAFRNRARAQIAAGEPLIFSKPDSIAAAKANPYYVTKDLPDGSVQIVAVKDEQAALEEPAAAAEKTPQVSDKITPSSGSYPEVASSTLAPATPEVTGLQAVSENTATPEQLSELSQSGVVDIVEGEPVINEEGQAALTQAGAPLPELTPEERRSEIAELNDEDAVDEDEYEDSDEEPEPNAVDTKLEQLQAEHKAKIEADKEERRKLLESRTQEQQQAIVDSFTPGQIITNEVTTGAFVAKTEDGGIVVKAPNGEQQKMSPATVQNATTATAIDPEPTQEKAKIAVLEETNDLGAAGFKPTGEVDEDGGEILEDKRKDGLGKPFTVSTKLFKKKDGTTVSRSSFTYAPKKVGPKNLKRTRQAEKLNVLRVMNQGVEVRVPNSIPAPAWMTVRPVEGKDYSTVVTAEYEENGINVGKFKAADRQGSFEDAYKKNQAIKNIKVDASNQNRQSREKAGTDATTKAAKRIQGASPLVEMLFSVISKPWFKSVESQIASDSLSGLGLRGQDEYRKIAANKIQNALSKISLEPNEEVKGAAGLVAKTAELFVSGTNASEIPKLVLEGRPQNTEETKLINRTVTALGELSIFASPSKHIAALEQVKAEALKYASLRPDDVSMDAKKEDGEDTQGDSLTASQLIQDSKQGKKGASKITLAAPGKISGEELETIIEADKLAKTALESGFLEKLEERKKSFTNLELLALDYLNAPDRTSQYEIKRTVEKQLLFLRDRRTFEQLLASVKRRTAELAEEVSGAKIDEAIPRRPAPKSRVAISAENIAAAQEQAKQLSFDDRRSVLTSEELSEDEIDALSDDEVERQVVQIFALNNAAREAEAPKAETKTKTAEPKKSKTVYDQETKTFKAVSATATPTPEVAEQVALTPDEKFADDYLNEPDAEKQQGMLDAFEKPRIEEAQSKMVERGIDQPTATKIAGNKVKQKTTELISAAYRRKSPQSPGKAKGAAKEIKGAPGRKPSSPKLQRIKRRFLQAKVGLSDEQMVGMSNAEVDRAYLAYNSRADENKAAAAQDAVVSVAPGIERLIELGDQELVGAYADAILTAEKEGDYGKLRDLNFNELVRFGAFESTRELLTRLADPKNKAPRDMQVRAKAFLDMEKRGLKLDNIEIQAANFLKTGTKDRAVWGGLLGRNADYSAFGVYINLDQAHDRETPLQTVLHELAHVATFAKTHGKVKTTAQEDRIIKDLDRMRRAAILKAGNATPAMKAAADKAGATTPEARLANYEKALKTMIANGEEGSRRYNGLQNLDEFIVEMTGGPEFVKLLSQLGFGALNADKRTFNGMIRDAFNAILKLIGVNINPSSELGKAFMDSWNFTFRGTKYKAAPSELLKAVRGVAGEAKAEPKAKAAKTKATKAAAPQGKAAETETQTSAAETTAGVSQSAPQGGAPVAETEVKAEGNNQVTEAPETKPKRGRGRPRKSESRNRTALPATKEEVEEKLSNSQEAFDLEIAPQSPAAFKQEVNSALEKQTKSFVMVRGEGVAPERVLKSALSALDNTVEPDWFLFTELDDLMNGTEVPNEIKNVAAKLLQALDAKFTAPQSPAAFKTPHVLHTVRDAEDIPEILKGVRNGTNITIDSTKPNQSIGLGGITLVIDPQSVDYKSKGYNSNEGAISKESKPRIVEILVDRDGYGQSGVTWEDIDKAQSEMLERIPPLENALDQAKADYDTVRSRLLKGLDFLSKEELNSVAWRMRESPELKAAELKRAQAERAYFQETKALEMSPQPSITAEDAIREELSELINRYPVYSFDTDEEGNAVEFQKVQSPAADPVKRHLETAGREKSKYGLFNLAPEAKGVIGLVQDLNAQAVLNYFEKHGVDWAKQRKVFSDNMTIDGKKYPPEWYDPKPEEDVKGWKKRIDIRDLRDELDTRTRIEDPETGMFEAQGPSFEKRIYRDLGFDYINSEFTNAPQSVEFQKVQSPAAKPRIVRASAANDTQDQADLRASNMEDILFYSGIDEGDYNKLINKGILTPKEIEAGYMQDVPKMLSNIAGDDTVVDGQPLIPAPLRHVAQMLIDLGFDFSKVRFRMVEDSETKAEGGYAGLYQAGTSARSGEISVNLDSAHQGGAAQTIVHEALHHVFFWKTQKGYPLNRVERAAFRDLEKIFKQAERLALGRYTKAGESIGQAKARLAPGDLFYGLTNLDEFITEILTNPQFQIFLQQAAPMQGLPKKGGYIRSLLDQIFSYLKDFIYGRDVSGDSLLTQGLDNVLAFIQTPQTEAGVQSAVEQMIGKPAPRATFGGEKADMPQFKRDSLEAARAMAADGKTSEEIRAVTGWFPGKYDGKMRWEIPDAGAKLRPDFGKAGKVYDLIDHPTLFDVYPSIAGVPVEFRGFTAGITKDGKALVLPAMTAGFSVDNSALLKGVLHETQHLVQAIEGFARGGNTDAVYDPEKARISQKQAQLEKVRDDARTAWHASRTDSNLAAYKASVDAVWEVMGQKPAKLSAESEMDYYKRIAGEIESRDIEARANMTPEQLAATAPYSSENIAPEDAVLMDAPMSPAGEAMKMIAKLTGAETKTTFNGGTYTAGGALSPDGKLDKQAGDKWRASRQQITAAARVIDTLSTRLVSAVKAAKKSGVEVSTETMNTALGNLDNPLTQPQRSEVRRMREIDEEEANTLEAAHLAKNREAFKVKQRSALAALPSNVAEAVSEMNEHIAFYSAMLKESGILDPHMAATVDANLGIYLHRSYEIFDNEKWAKQVRENTKVMRAAERLIKRNLEQRNAAELIRQTEGEGGFISKADAEAQTKGTVKQEHIDKVIDDLLAIGEDGMGGVILRGRIPGQKDLSIFDTRGNISPEIQALWGRYEDPTINYAKSVMKMSSLVANHQFLSDLRGTGLKEGWLYNGPETDRPRGYLKISSDNNKSLAPLSGLHGDKLLVEALYQMFPQNGLSDNYAWVRALSKVTGWSMAAKTVLSPVSQVRNNLGNMLFDVAAGNFGFSDIPKLKGRLGTAFNMSFRSAFNAYPSDNAFRKAMMSEMQELVRRGVIGESIVGNMLGQLMEAKRFSKTQDQFSNHLIGKLQKSAGAVWDTAQKTYASSDDFWKVMGYMAEVDKYTKAMPGWSPEQVKDHAAKIVRDIRPTYSLSPAALDKVKAFPFVAPFITFTTEVIRTSINLMKLARYEITEGNRTGNKELQAIGWKRARGIVLASFGPGAASVGFMAMAGIGDDDEERLRRFLPNWQKNSQLLLLGNKDGKVSYLDVSFLDPYDYWKKSFGAFMRSLTARDDAEAMERITRGAMDAAGELLRPFKSEQLVSGAVTDILRNQDSAGRQIYNPQDTGFNIAAKTTERLWKAFSPGAFDVAGRVWKAGAGDVSDSGRAYNLFNELGGLAAGQRITEVNVEQALAFKASQFGREIRDASAIFSREFNSKGTRSPEEIADAYERANDASYRLTADFRDDVLAAIGLGKISPKQAEEILKANRIGKEDIAVIRSGRYKKYEPSDAAKKIAPKDRIKAADAAVKRAKDTPL